MSEHQESEIEELKGQFMSKIVTPSTTSQAPEDMKFEVEGFDYEASKRMKAGVEDYATPLQMMRAVCMMRRKRQGSPERSCFG